MLRLPLTMPRSLHPIEVVGITAKKKKKTVHFKPKTTITSSIFTSGQTNTHPGQTDTRKLVKFLEHVSCNLVTNFSEKELLRSESRTSLERAT